MIHKPDAKRLFCTDCDQVTRFDLAGENMARRPVFRCSECGNQRAGFYSAKPTVEIATDGGSDE